MSVLVTPTQLSRMAHGTSPRQAMQWGTRGYDKGLGFEIHAWGTNAQFIALPQAPYDCVYGEATRLVMPSNL